MKDRIWQIIGAVSAVIAILVTVGTFYLSQRSNKMELTAEIISNTNLLRNDISSNSNELKLTYKNKEIQNVSILNIKFINTGRLPIRSSDIELPLSIKMNCTELLSSKVVATYTPNLPISISNINKSVIVEKTLINPDDEVTIEIISIPKDGTGNIVSGIQGRIAGISEIKLSSLLNKDQKNNRFLVSILKGFLFGIGAAILQILFFKLGEKVGRNTSNKKV